jgi:hypothetical protein
MSLRKRAWKKVGGLLLAAAMGSPLFVSMPAEAATGESKVAPEVPKQAACAKEGCIGAIGDELPNRGDRKLGTAITWAESPDAAWHEARDEGKLVFLIQVSGNFARQEFT